MRRVLQWSGNYRRRVFEKRKLEMRTNQLEFIEDVGKRCRGRWGGEGDRDGRRVLVVAGCEQGNSALVIRGAGLAVNLLVQLRNRGENDREKDSDDAAGGNDRAQDCFAITQAGHFVGECASGAANAQGGFRGG